MIPNTELENTEAIETTEISEEAQEYTNYLFGAALEVIEEGNELDWEHAKSVAEGALLVNSYNTDGTLITFNSPEEQQIHEEIVNSYKIRTEGKGPKYQLENVACIGAARNQEIPYVGIAPGLETDLLFDFIVGEDPPGVETAEDGAINGEMYPPEDVVMAVELIEKLDVSPEMKAQYARRTKQYLEENGNKDAKLISNPKLATCLMIVNSKVEEIEKGQTE